MLHSTKDFLINFYQRNIFERLIIYSFVSFLVVKIIFELGLGQWSFVQSQNKQWVFFGLLALDYLVSLPKVIKIRVTVNPMSICAMMFFAMVVHGLFVGIMLNNKPMTILDDTIPLLMIGLNILRMQSLCEFAPIDFRRLFLTCMYFALALCALGLLGKVIGRPTEPSVGNTTLLLPLFFAGLFLLRPFPKWAVFAMIFMIGLTMSDLNRTVMAFLALILSTFLLVRTIKNPVEGLAVGAAVCVVLALAVMFVPEDSKTYQRVVGLTQIDLSERKGSIGERQAEWDAIQLKLQNSGETIEWLGLGFGGVYEVARTHGYLRDYGHAHYSWAWFNLRYGKSGYIYLALFVAALLYNAFYQLRIRNETSMFVGMMCILCVLYCVTYVNAVFLLSGVCFFFDPTRRMSKEQSTTLETITQQK